MSVNDETQNESTKWHNDDDNVSTMIGRQPGCKWNGQLFWGFFSGWLPQSVH